MKISPRFLPVTGPYDLDRLSEAVYAGLDAGDRICTMREIPRISAPFLTVSRVIRRSESVIDRHGIPHQIVQSIRWLPDGAKRAQAIDPATLYAPIRAALVRYQHIVCAGGFTEPILDVGTDTCGRAFLGDAVTAAVRSGMAEFDAHRFLRIREDVVAERRATARRSVWSDTF